VNDLLAQAVKTVEKDGIGETNDRRFERFELRPDQRFDGDGRALFRAVVILLRLVVKSAPGTGVFAIKPYLVLNPQIELDALRARSRVHILHTAEFRRDDKIAVGIEIAGPSGGIRSEQVAALFSTSDCAPAHASPWSALAMVARLNGALVMETKPGFGIRYLVIIKI